MKFSLFQHLHSAEERSQIYRVSARMTWKVMLMGWCCVLGLCFNNFPCLAADSTLRSKDLTTENTTFEDIKTLVQRANALHVSGDDRKAIPVFEEALAISIRAFGNDDAFVASLQRAVGGIYQAQADYSKSLRLYEASLATREKIFGPNHPEVANTLNSIASYYREKDDHAKAQSLYERSLSITEKSFGPEHPNVAYVLDGLAQVSQGQGDFQSALSLYERSLCILEKAFGPAESLSEKGVI